MSACRIDDESGRGVLRMTGGVGIQNAVEMRDALVEAVGRYSDLTVDFTELGDADIVVYQLLASAHKTLKQRGGRIGIRGMSQQHISRARHFGCAALVDKFRVDKGE